MAVTSHNFSHYKLPLQIPRTASVISVYRPASPTRPLCFTTLIILRVSTLTSRRSPHFVRQAGCSPARTRRKSVLVTPRTASVLSVLLTRRTSFLHRAVALCFGQRAHRLALCAIRCSLFFAPASCADTSRAVGHPSCASHFGQRPHRLGLCALRHSLSFVSAPSHLGGRAFGAPYSSHLHRSIQPDDCRYPNTPPASQGGEPASCSLSRIPFRKYNSGIRDLAPFAPTTIALLTDSEGVIYSALYSSHYHGSSGAPHISAPLPYDAHYSSHRQPVAANCCARSRFAYFALFNPTTAGTRTSLPHHKEESLRLAV